MSILINGMKMPKNCDECFFLLDEVFQIGVRSHKFKKTKMKLMTQTIDQTGVLLRKCQKRTINTRKRMRAI